MPRKKRPKKTLYKVEKGKRVVISDEAVEALGLETEDYVRWDVEGKTVRLVRVPV